MSDGVLEVCLHYMKTKLAGERFHVEIVEEGCINGLSLDPMILHIGGIG